MADSHGLASGILGQRVIPGAASDSVSPLEFEGAEAGLCCVGEVWGGVKTGSWAEVDLEERFDESPLWVFLVCFYWLLRPVPVYSAGPREH